MTPDRVTPEQAQKMLDRVKEWCPLPWEIYTTETFEVDPREVKSVRYSDPVYDGHLAYPVDYDGTTEIDPDAIELVAAAPELAEIVANLRYEYAVQVKMSSGEWHYTDEEQYPFGGESPCSVMWSPQGYAEEMLESFAELDGREYLRIVRRLVSDVEVVE